MSAEFRPDWCLAPSVCLKGWLEERNISVLELASACSGAGDEYKPLEAFTAAVLIRDVLNRKPLTQEHADVLTRAPGMPSAQFWLNFEHNYRAGLAAGLIDASD